VRVAEAVDAHSGFELPFSPYSLWPFRPSAADHDWHHSNNTGNYGSFFTWWDRGMGTDRIPAMGIAAKASKRQAGTSAGSGSSGSGGVSTKAV
jgi:sterol desaturase/sphingolipid hydroxylase (fatty acid hydroxylase superfamily)